MKRYWSPFPHPLLFSYQNEFLQHYSFVSVSGAGTTDVNGIYYPLGLFNYSFVWENSQHMHLSRERIDGTIGWILGNMQICYYGQPTEALFPPSSGWRMYAGAEPAPSLTCHLHGDSVASFQLKSAYSLSRDIVNWDASLERSFL